MSAKRHTAESLEPRRLFVSPVTAVDFYNVNEDQSLVVAAPQGVLANDFDPDGQPLIATVVNLPQHGNVSMSPTGEFTYTPDPDFFGFDAARKLKYRGRLDEGGRATPAPGAKRELVEAMRAIAAGREPAEQTPAIGCSIKWKAA